MFITSLLSVMLFVSANDGPKSSLIDFEFCDDGTHIVSVGTTECAMEKDPCNN